MLLITVICAVNQGECTTQILCLGLIRCFSDRKIRDELFPLISQTQWMKLAHMKVTIRFLFECNFDART